MLLVTPSDVVAGHPTDVVAGHPSDVVAGGDGGPVYPPGGGRHVGRAVGGRAVLTALPAAEEVDAHPGVEAGVDDGVGGAVERRQALDEGADGHRLLALGDEAVDVQQVEHEVRAPEDHEHWQGKRQRGKRYY